MRVQGFSVSFRDSKDESGSGLIWFINLIALVALFSGTLISASHEYLFARKLTDYAEEYVLAVKALRNLNPQISVGETGKEIFLVTASQFNFSELRIRSVEEKTGNTIHAVVCATWKPPVAIVLGNKEICEEAFAR